MCVLGRLWRCLELALKVLAAFAAAYLTVTIVHSWRGLSPEFADWLSSPGEEELRVPITVLGKNAVQTGAVCLDGSPPAYHLDRGSGLDSKNWVVSLDGGGWCADHVSCWNRTGTAFGSSLHMEALAKFSGILSNSPTVNPDFYSWNRVRIRYCDGASFAGFVDNEEKGLNFKGQKIWRAVIAELLDKGMINAEKALLTGCSAGGLAVIIHCNEFRQLLPRGTLVKCLSDAGFFLDAKDVSGNFSFRSFYKNVVDLQNVRPNLPETCIKTHDALCFFPQLLLPQVEVPLFILNAAYDVWQIQYILAPDSADPSGQWTTCKNDPYSCSAAQLEVFQGFRTEFMKALSYARQRDGWGLFIDSCFMHCQIFGDDALNEVKIGNKTIVAAVGDWYFDRNSGTDINLDEVPYPSNPTCLKWTGYGN